MTTIELTTTDPNEIGTIHHIIDGEDMEILIELGNSEDTAEWERQADAHILEAGYRRVAPWGQYGTQVVPE